MYSFFEIAMLRRFAMLIGLLISVSASLLPSVAEADKKTSTTIPIAPKRVVTAPLSRVAARTRLPPQSQRVSALSPDGRWLARVETRGVIALWDLQLAEQSRFRAKQTKPASRSRQRRPRRMLRLSPKPAKRAAIRMRFVRRSNAAQKSSPLLVAFVYDPTSYSVGGGYGSVRDRLSVWSVPSGKRLLYVKPPSTPSRGNGAAAQLFDWAVAGRLLATNFSGKVVIYDLLKRKKVRCAVDVNSDAELSETEPAIALSQDGRQLALAEPSSENIEIYNVSKRDKRKGRACRRIASHKLPICQQAQGYFCNGAPFMAYSRLGLVVSDGAGALIRRPGQSTSKRFTFDDRRVVPGYKYAAGYALIGGRTLRLRTRHGKLVDRDLSTRKRREHAVKLPEGGTWSPDGRLYLYAKNGALELLHLGTGQRYRLSGAKATAEMQTVFVKGKKLSVVVHSGDTIATWTLPHPR
jgi:hypothetical protein